MTATAKAIVELVSRRFDVDVDELHGPSRKASLAHARSCAMWLLERCTRLSTVEIGALFGRDHSTVRCVVGNLWGRARDPETARELAELLEALRTDGAPPSSVAEAVADIDRAIAELQAARARLMSVKAPRLPGTPQGRVLAEAETIRVEAVRRTEAREDAVDGRNEEDSDDRLEEEPQDAVGDPGVAEEGRNASGGPGAERRRSERQPAAPGGVAEPLPPAEDHQGRDRGVTQKATPDQADLIARVVAEHYGCAPDDLIGRERRWSGARAACWLLLHEVGMGWNVLGRRFDGRSGPTVLLAVKGLREREGSDPALKARLNDVRAAVAEASRTAAPRDDSCQDDAKRQPLSKLILSASERDAALQRQARLAAGARKRQQRPPRLRAAPPDARD